MSTSSSPEPLPCDAALADLETFLRQWLLPAATPTAGRAPDPPRGGPGRPPTLPALALWAGLLVGLLRGLPSQRDLWRLLACHGLWDFPRFEITDQALYVRLQRTLPAQMQQFFTALTAQLRLRLPPASALDLAPWAPEIMAVDHTVLDPLLRKRKLLRSLPRGDAALLPGALGCVFDVRRQLWNRVEYVSTPIQNMREAVLHLSQDLPAGSLLLFDLGYFSFWGYDELTATGFAYVTRLRQKLSFTVEHIFYDGPLTAAADPGATCWDGLIYLGAHRSDRAAQPVRLIQITVGGQTYRYVTNVLDPRRLSAREVAQLYPRRWDIERAFDLLKTDLKLHLLWSGHANALLLQVDATCILAQILLALRNQVAQQAGADVREVSLPLLIRWFPRLAAEGKDPVAEFAAVGRQAGYIRPFRGKERELPAVPTEAYTWPARPIPSREPRYRSGPVEGGRAPARKPPRPRVAASPYRPYGHKLTS